MLSYLLRRIVYALPIMLGVALVCFLLVHLAPGDPLVSILPPDASADLQAQLPHALAEMRRALVVLRPGERLPDAEVLLPDGHALGILQRTLAQHLGQSQFGKIHDSHLLRRL